MKLTAGGFTFHPKLTEAFDGTVWNSKTTEDFPEPVWGHCMVKINSSTIFSIGGYNAGYSYKETYFYNAEVNKWIPGPSLNLGRHELSCGILKWKNPESNQVEKVVVAAGGLDDFARC
jgi:hypothetical protein